MLKQIGNALVPRRFHEYKLWAYNWLKHGFRLGLPTGIGIETSRACNRRCVYCPQSIEPLTQSIIGDDVWEMFLFRLREFRWRGLASVTSYNEFALVKNSDRYIRQLREAGSMPLIFSNGDMPDVIEKWVHAGAYSIIITEHPPFRDAWARRLAPVAKRYPGVIRVQRLSGEVIHDHAGRMKGIGQAFTRCDMHLGMSFGINGNASLCCLDYTKDTFDFGNFMERSFAEIWYQPYYVQLRRDIYNGIPRTSLCRKCFRVPEPESNNPTLLAVAGISSRAASTRRPDSVRPVQPIARTA